MENKPVNIFWTGGWDSTFRVLQLLIEEKRRVQPHFVVRSQASVGHEIKTMIDIRRQIFRNFPDTRSLLRPTKYYDILYIDKNIDKNKEIKAHFERIKASSYLANQYIFLASLCNHYSLMDVEMCAVKSGSVTNLLKPLLTKVDDSIFVLNSKKCESEFQKSIYELFKYYRFPVMHLSKLHAGKIAKENGFSHLMKMTWFCATPINGKPCGFCGPCIDAIKMGLPDRIPFINRQISRLHLPLRNIYRKRFKSYRT